MKLHITITSRDRETQDCSNRKADQAIAALKDATTARGHSPQGYMKQE